MASVKMPAKVFCVERASSFRETVSSVVKVSPILTYESLLTSQAVAGASPEDSMRDSSGCQRLAVSCSAGLRERCSAICVNSSLVRSSVA